MCAIEKSMRRQSSAHFQQAYFPTSHVESIYASAAKDDQSLYAFLEDTSKYCVRCFRE